MWKGSGGEASKGMMLESTREGPVTGPGRGRADGGSARRPGRGVGEPMVGGTGLAPALNAEPGRPYGVGQGWDGGREGFGRSAGGRAGPPPRAWGKGMG
jgi:hypothetical protein